MVAANKLNRKWAGIDISPFAIESVMQERFLSNGFNCKIIGAPVDLKSAIDYASEDPFAFEAWAIQRIPGLVPNERQRGDGGIDGRGILAHEVDSSQENEILVQVKSGKVDMDQAKSFIATCDNHELAVGGLFIVMTKNAVSRNMRTMYNQKGSFQLRDSINEYPRMQFGR